MDNTKLLLEELQKLGDPEKAKGAAKFFQAAKGGYGEGDKFWGVTVPGQRALSKKYCKLLTSDEMPALLRHEVHEARLCALMTLVLMYQKTKNSGEKSRIVRIYRDALPCVNNWDLVDSSAPHILGDWCVTQGYAELLGLARSGELWKQRVAMISTQAFIRQNILEPVFEIADILLEHKHDLIHKAVGWMLREAGNRDFEREYSYLARNYKRMPRTMLRYAIEKFVEPLRQKFLKGTV